MEQTYSPIPTQWDNGKFEIDFNCVVYAQDDSLIIISDEGIDNLEEKIQANITYCAGILQQKQNLMNRLGLTQEDIKLLIV